MNIKTIGVQQFASNMEKNKDKLHFLKLAYLAAQVRAEEIEECFNAIYNDVLAENEFYADEDSDSLNIKKGDRITDKKNCFLMSSSEHNNFIKLTVKKMFELSYTDEEGNYTKDYCIFDIKNNAENALIDFQLSLLPEALKEKLKDIKKNYSHRQKFINIIMQSGQ